jgi:hypothetical protein
VEHINLSWRASLASLIRVRIYVCGVVANQTNLTQAPITRNNTLCIGPLRIQSCANQLSAQRKDKFSELVLANVTKHVFLIPDTFPTEKGAFPGSFSP